MTNTTNAIEVTKTDEQKALEVLTAIKELSVYKSKVFENQIYDEESNGLFVANLYKASDVEQVDITFYVITIVEGLGGDQLFSGMLFDNHVLINNEEMSYSDIIAKADAAMRKFIGQ